jgi:GNAT superfamily N-acetyltransferase
MTAPVFSDLALSQRLERAEGRAGSRYVEAHARLAPHSGAEWTEIGGAYAMYDGTRSPVTQTFGLGLFQPAAETDLDRIEAFFRQRGAPIFHEVSPLADKALMPLLCARGYKPVELTSVMYLPLAARPATAPPRNENIRTRIVEEPDREIWVRTSVEGWKGLVEFDDLMLELMRMVSLVEGGRRFLAEIDGSPIAAGALNIDGEVALLAGACTIPEARNQGAQRALLEARLRHAAESGCALAMMGAEPGSASQRNAERQGFRIAYTRLKWGSD